MKIIYKQPQEGSVFHQFGIGNCCFKQLYFEKSAEDTSKREHHHTGYELHIIVNGYQLYKIGNDEYKVNGGEFLLIPQGIKHRAVGYAPKTSKISLTFETDKSLPVTAKATPKAVTESIGYILEESKNRSTLSYQIIENRIFELLMVVLRQCGFTEDTIALPETREDARLSMAKQYIKDNIEYNLKVSDVAAYCYLSTKQLTRLFCDAGDITPARYIQKQKIHHIEKLLADAGMSLHDISDRMNFTSEYHFNSFFKKYAGMPPGEYRKMNR